MQVREEGGRRVGSKVCVCDSGECVEECLVEQERGINHCFPSLSLAPREGLELSAFCHLFPKWEVFPPFPSLSDQV